MYIETRWNSSNTVRSVNMQVIITLVVNAGDTLTIAEENINLVSVRICNM